MVNLVLFFIALSLADAEWKIIIGRIFFIWVSVFNLFVVSIYWSLIVDVFTAEQGKRLFSFLAAGATLGGITGSGIISLIINYINPNMLLLLSVALLEIAVYASRKLSFLGKATNREDDKDTEKAPISGSVLSGLTHTLKSPYLIGISFFIFLNSVTSTFLYFQQADIVKEAFTNSADRTAFFARVDLWVNIFTLVFQMYLAARLLRFAGVAIVLCSLPFVSVLGFGLLSLFPGVMLLVTVQVARRVSNFGLSRPTREILFTNLSREDQYKAKNFIDTVIYRTGDQMGGWTYSGAYQRRFGHLGYFFCSSPPICCMVIPFLLAWKQTTFLRLRKSSQITGLHTPSSAF
jgi:AAA family ATP:ADP antiporter